MSEFNEWLVGNYFSDFVEFRVYGENPRSVIVRTEDQFGDCTQVTFNKSDVALMIEHLQELHKEMI